MFDPELAKASTPVVETPHYARAYFDWGWPHFGFGQLSFGMRDDGKIYIDNECMSRDAVRKILHAFADHVADNGVLVDARPEEKTDAQN